MSFAQSPFIPFQPTRFAPAGQALQDISNSAEWRAGQEAFHAAHPAAAAASAESCPVCPKLPSSDSAYLLCLGDPRAPWLMLRDFIGRSFLVGTGMYIAGEREHLVRNAMAGGAAIEFFVVAYIWWSTRQQPKPVYLVPTPPSG